MKGERRRCWLRHQITRWEGGVFPVSISGRVVGNFEVTYSSVRIQQPWGPLSFGAWIDDSAVPVVPNIKERMEAQHIIPSLSLHDSLQAITVGYARTNVIVSRTLFIIASVFLAYIEICVFMGYPFQAHSLQQSYHPT